MRDLLAELETGTLLPFILCNKWIPFLAHLVWLLQRGMRVLCCASLVYLRLMNISVVRIVPGLLGYSLGYILRLGLDDKMVSSMVLKYGCPSNPESTSRRGPNRRPKVLHAALITKARGFRGPIMQ